MPEEMDQILPRLARELMEETPGLVGVLQNINTSRTNIVAAYAQAEETLRLTYFDGAGADDDGAWAAGTFGAL